jgi:energy-coupling factor transporter ATP-binding protein EcfA2
MNTNNVHSYYSFDSKQPLQEQDVLKEYRPYEGCQIKMLFDSFEGVTATILDEEGKKEVIAFDRINGIPTYLRFNVKKLFDYLTDTYISVRAYEDGSRKLCVNLKMRGGGNGYSSHSSHAQSFTNATYKKIASYSSAVKIQKVEAEPSGPNGYLSNPSGGVDHTSYSITNTSTQDNCYPQVNLYFYSRDYYAKELLQERKIISEQNEIKLGVQKQKNILVESINKTNLLIQESEVLKSIYSKNKENACFLKKSIEDVGKKLNDLNVEKEQIFNAINYPENNIINLNDFIKCADKYKISIFESEPNVIIEYRKKSANIKNIQSFNSNSFLGNAIYAIEKTASASKKVIGKDIIALIGNTGAGKSTLINYLWGLKMIKNNGRIEVENSNEEIAKIGHSKGSSETRITQIYEKTNSYTFVDCGGFLDTRGDDVDIEVVSSLKFTLEGAKSVKLGICCDCSLLGIDRGVGFTAFLKQALKGLIINYQDHQGSILLMLTKPKNIDGDFYNKEDAINELKEIQKDLIDDDDKKLYQYILRDEGKHVCVCNPLADSKEELTTFDSMSGIYTPSKAFNIPYSNSVLLKLRNTMITTANTANELFLKYKLSQEKYDSEALNFKNFKDEEERIKNVINQNNVKLKEKESFLQNISLETIKQQINAIDIKITECDDEIEESESSIKDLDTMDLVKVYNIDNEWGDNL